MTCGPDDADCTASLPFAPSDDGHTLPRGQVGYDNELFLANGHANGKPYGKPQIGTTHVSLDRLTTLAWAAIRLANTPPTLFRSGGIASRIEGDDKDEPLVRTVESRRMRYHLARVANWTKTVGSKANAHDVPTSPPMEVVNDVLATPNMPLPVLTRIVEAPVFAADGTLQTEPGYHAASQTYYAPAKGFVVADIAERPTSQEIKTARELLTVELLGDFPFIGPAELAHAVALLILPFVRELIDGSTPLHLFEKPSPGTGATLLCDMLAMPATGRPLPTMTEGRSEDEWRKRVTSKLRSPSQFFFIDNLRGRLDSAAVASAITSPTWDDRVLGASEVVKIPVRCAWLASGNNPALSSEMARRTVRIRMDARMDRPWLREGFRHPNLRAWTKQNRGRLVWSALTLGQAWIAEGRPAGAKTLGMFESWAETIGGILDVAGIPGFLDNLTNCYEESDAEGATWRAFLASWWDTFQSLPVKVSDLYSIATGDDCLSLGNGSEQSQRVVLGKMLAEKRDHVFDLESESGVVRLTVQRGSQCQRAYQWHLQQSQP